MHGARLAGGAPGGGSGVHVDDLSNKATFYYDIIHLVSLLHAVSIQELRLDDSLDNLITYDIDDDDCNPPINVDRYQILKSADRANLSWMERSTGRWFSLRRRFRV